MKEHLVGIGGDEVGGGGGGGEKRHEEVQDSVGSCQTCAGALGVLRSKLPG